MGQLKEDQAAGLPKLDRLLQQKEALRQQARELRVQLRLLENETAQEEVVVQNLHHVHDIEKELREQRRSKQT